MSGILVNGQKLKVFEAFAGIGTQAMGLEKAGVAYEVVGISDINEYSVEAYHVIHGGHVKNYGDITKIEKFPQHDLFTYSFPCQDISNAGKQRGLVEGSGTRSSLLWECERVIEQVRPTYLLLENVEPLGSSMKFRAGLTKWLDTLESYGYENYCIFMNARNYGVPQNRARFLVFSTLNKDIFFEAPKEIPLEKQVIDFLDTEVEQRYFAKIETAMRFVVDPSGENASEFIDNFNTIRMLGYLGTKSQGNKVYDPYGVTPCITTGQPSYFRVNGKLRLLTPRECYRLMGVQEEYTQKVYNHFINKYGPGKTDEQMYFQAGNAIVVDVLAAIFRNAFIEPYK